jgi:vancomycin resistance protein YoaR
MTRGAQLLKREVVLRAEEFSFETTAVELGGRYDIDAFTRGLQEEVLRTRRELHQSPGRLAYRKVTQTRHSVPNDLVLSYDEPRLREVLARISSVVNRDARDAALLIDEHRVVESRPGRKVSIDATVARFEAQAEREDDSLPSHPVDLVFERLEPRIREEHLAPVDVTRVLASYETSFRGKAGPRGVNIRTAGRYLDGAVILPGEVLSFNEQVGRRIHGRGFVDAPVIVNDEMELDVGGGVCQVATTLHAAAVYGNLEVVRRRSHSRPSGYAPLGLDATVIDGKVDLRLRNPYDEPLLVHVSFPAPYLIRVELLGAAPRAKVEHAYAVTAQEPFARRVWHREELAPGTLEQKQKGSPGMDVVSVLRILHEDGRTERRSYASKYYPVPEVFWVSEAGAGAQLPELPEGASALVVDGEPIQQAESPVRPEQEVPTLDQADSSVL